MRRAVKSAAFNASTISIRSQIRSGPVRPGILEFPLQLIQRGGQQLSHQLRNVEADLEDENGRQDVGQIAPDGIQQPQNGRGDIVHPQAVKNTGDKEQKYHQVDQLADHRQGVTRLLPLRTFAQLGLCQELLVLFLWLSEVV